MKTFYQKLPGLGVCLFLTLATIGFFGWIISRFWKPIYSVSYGGFHDFTIVSLLFVIALSLAGKAIQEQE